MMKGLKQPSILYRGGSRCSLHPIQIGIYTTFEGQDLGKYLRGYSMLTDSYMPAQDDIAAAESKTLQPEKSNYVRKKHWGEKSS